MRLLSLSLAATVIGAASPALAGPISDAERARLVAYLEETREAVVVESRGLAPVQARFQPGPDRWSVLHVVEHLAVVEANVLTQTRAALPHAQPSAGTRPDLRGREEALILRARDRVNKLQAPEPVQPKLRWGTLDAALAAFLERRQQTIDFVRTTDGDLHGLVAKHPVLGLELDAYQSLFVLPAHAERHTAQIREVKAAPGFPTAAATR